MLPLLSYHSQGRAISLKHRMSGEEQVLSKPLRWVQKEEREKLGV